MELSWPMKLRIAAVVTAGVVLIGPVRRRISTIRHYNCRRGTNSGSTGISERAYCLFPFLAVWAGNRHFGSTSRPFYLGSTLRQYGGFGAGKFHPGSAPGTI